MKLSKSSWNTDKTGRKCGWIKELRFLFKISKKKINLIVTNMNELLKKISKKKSQK